MGASQKSPSASQWLRDIQAVAALEPASEDGVRGIVYAKYPDAGWADEYVSTLWKAFCFLIKHQNAFEQHGLVVLGAKRAITKNCLLIALYRPFLSAPMERLERMDFSVDELAASAKEIQRRLRD